MFRYAIVALLLAGTFIVQDALAQSSNGMKAQLAERLAALEAEYAAGEQQLVELEQRRTELTQTLLRISGAIQVLHELMEEDANPPAQ